MSPGLLYGLTGAALFCLGLVALFSRPDLLRKILAINICGSAIFLLMISTAYDPDGGAPDPVLHALVLTGIVITISITAFALALASRQQREPGSGREAGSPPPTSAAADRFPSSRRPAE